MHSLAKHSYDRTPLPQKFPEDIQVIISPLDGKGGIYISNVEAAQNLETLSKYSIKAVLTAASGMKLNHPQSIIPNYKYIPGLDHDDFDMSKYFDQAVDFISQHLKTTNVLVHCIAGVSRSVSLVLAYLIKMRGMRYEEAYKLVKLRRPIIHPNKGFVAQLKRYQMSNPLNGEYIDNLETTPLTSFRQRMPQSSTYSLSKSFYQPSSYLTPNKKRPASQTSIKDLENTRGSEKLTAFKSDPFIYQTTSKKPSILEETNLKFNSSTFVTPERSYSYSTAANKQAQISVNLRGRGAGYMYLDRYTSRISNTDQQEEIDRKIQEIKKKYAYTSTYKEVNVPSNPENTIINVKQTNLQFENLQSPEKPSNLPAQYTISKNNYYDRYPASNSGLSYYREYARGYKTRPYGDIDMMNLRTREDVGAVSRKKRLYWGLSKYRHSLNRGVSYY